MLGKIISQVCVILLFIEKAIICHVMGGCFHLGSCGVAELVFLGFSHGAVSEGLFKYCLGRIPFDDLVCLIIPWGAGIKIVHFVGRGEHESIVKLRQVIMDLCLLVPLRCHSLFNHVILFLIYVNRLGSSCLTVASLGGIKRPLVSDDSLIEGHRLFLLVPRRQLGVDLLGFACFIHLIDVSENGCFVHGWLGGGICLG